MTPDRTPDAASGAPVPAAAFGAHAPGGLALALRRLGMAFGPGRVGKIARSLIFRLNGGYSGRAFDLTVFGDQRARLRPVGNICEKRVFSDDRWWEAAERAFIARIAATGAGPFHFLDVGANVGLYTLAARSAARAAGRPFRAALVEPQPEMQARLAANLAASGAGPDEALVLPWAATAAPTRLALTLYASNFGSARVADGGAGGDATLAVEGRPLLDAVRAAGFPRIDVMKIDIEGHEAAALVPFLADADPALWPEGVIIEARRGDLSGGGLQALVAKGYRVEATSRMNAMLRRPVAATGAGAAA